MLSSQFAFGFGLVSCLIAGTMLGLRFFVMERNRAGQLAAAMLLLAGVAGYLATTHGKPGPPMAAQTTAQSLTFVPLLLFLLRKAWLYIAARRMPEPGEWFLATMGLWLAGFAVVIGFGRGGVAPRYFEFVLYLVPVSFAALWVFLGDMADRLAKHRRRILLGWFVVETVLLIDTIKGVLRMVRHWSEILHGEFGVVKAYLLTGDRGLLLGKPNLAIPFPDGNELADLIDRARRMDILPASSLTDGRYFAGQAEVATALFVVAALAAALLVPGALRGAWRLWRGEAVAAPLNARGGAAG